jgi:hypothetical protein
MRSPVELSVTPKTPAPGYMSTGCGEVNALNKRRRVQVWFGKEVICSHEADAAQAQRYAVLMARRFTGLRVTIDDHPSSSDRALPNELLWDSTVL